MSCSCHINHPHWVTEDGTLSYLDAGGEQTVAEVTPVGLRTIISTMTFDLSNLTQNGTFKLYSKVDGTNYRQIDSLAVVAGDAGAVIVGPFYIDTDFKVTYTESVDEGADRDIPYRLR